MVANQFDYENALRDRLSQIQDFGTQQTTWEKLQASRKRQAQQAADQNAQMTTQYNSQQAAQNSMGQVNSTSFDAFRNAISGQESSGNYQAVNKSSGALGKYQIMPFNVTGWSHEALGYSVTPQQYLASPQLQEQVASYKLNQYYQKYGAAGAAIAWYAGGGAADRYARTGKTGVANSYMQQILKRMGQ